MVIKAKCINGTFKPMEQLYEIAEKYADKEVEIEIIPKLEELVGTLKELKISSVQLQHKIKDMW